MKFGLNFQESPKYQEIRLSGPWPPPGNPNAGFSVEKPTPLPILTFVTG